MSDLLARHDVLLADLDGTLYRGRAAVPGAVEAVTGAAARGVRTVYVTNNASRRPAEVAGHLAELGFPAAAADVATSSQAAAAMLAQRLPAGAAVLVVGTDALVAELEAVGLTAVRTSSGAVAVVQGHDPHTGWVILAEAALALRAGALWVACNVDPTLPTERGPLPGNGSMVAALRTATGLTPEVAGKPAPTLLRDAARRAGARHGLVVGDRLDTDIEGGRAARIATMLVLTGVSDAAELLAAPPAQRPDLVAADLGALTADVDSLAPGPRPGWEVRGPRDGVLRLASTSGVDPLDALRALCAAHWAAGGGAARVRPEDEVAAAALAELGLASAGTVSTRAPLTLRTSAPPTQVSRPALPPVHTASATVAGADTAPGARA